MKVNPNAPEIIYPPTISSISHTPYNPTHFETITFQVTVSDPDDDVISVTLYYSIDSGNWQSESMDESNDVYSTTLGPFTMGNEIQFYVRAEDSEGNVVNSIINCFSIGVYIGTEYDPLEDGFSFKNPGWTSSCFQLSLEEVITILLNDEFHYYLEEGGSSVLKYLAIYLFGKLTHGYGHCYGMCALSMNYYNGYLSTPGGSIPYELTYDQVASDIEYYQNWQILNVNTYSILRSWGADNSPISDENQWDLIRSSVENGNPIIIGLQSEIGKHAVIGYAINEEGDVLIYDPSYPMTDQDSSYIIDITQEDSGIDIYYQWEDGTIFYSWVALSYEQSNIVEWYYGQLENSLWVKADCPLELYVLDKNGNEVGDSSSDGETHLVVITNPSNEDYKVKLIGTGNGEYDIMIARIYNNQTTYNNISGAIKSGETIEYKIIVSDGIVELEEITPSEGKPFFSDYWWSFIIIGILILLSILIILRKRSSSLSVEEEGKEDTPKEGIKSKEEEITSEGEEETSEKETEEDSEENHVEANDDDSLL
jgi:hypothetical protein